MMIDNIIILALGTVTSMVGALPFGLVNLTVLNASIEKGSRPAMQISYGAAFVEVLFGLTAILTGGLLAEYIEGNQIISYFTAAVLITGGLFFFLKKQSTTNERQTKYSGFFKGVFLNLVSLRVFLFWILAIAFLSSRQLLQYDLLSVLIFISGIWTGKMIILLLYMNLSRKVLAGSRIISRNINRIIGIVLIGMAFVQVIKM
jgi:threonine/homoserine/homoserine lactone efflux protein